MIVHVLKWELRITLGRTPVAKRAVWKFACKHGHPNFVHCPECDRRASEGA